jgi:hypothetical protein
MRSAPGSFPTNQSARRSMRFNCYRKFEPCRREGSRFDSPCGNAEAIRPIKPIMHMGAD